MNPTNSALPLRDIHLPEPISWWPPAPGWWLLLILIIILIALIPFLLKRIKQKPINKTALNAFHNIQDHYKHHQNQQILAQQVSVLLRRTCMSYAGRQQTASITGQAWINQLNQLTGKNIFSDEITNALLNAPYQANSAIDSSQLLQQCQQWFEALPGKRMP